MPSHTRKERSKRQKTTINGGSAVSKGVDFSSKKTGVMAPSGRLKIAQTR